MSDETPEKVRKPSKVGGYLHQFRHWLYTVSITLTISAVGFVSNWVWENQSAIAALQSQVAKLQDENKAQWTMLRETDALKTDFLAQKQLQEQLLWPFLRARLMGAETPAGVTQLHKPAPPDVAQLVVPPAVQESQLMTTRKYEPLTEFKSRAMQNIRKD